jgi:hypothetical protein
VQLKSTPFLRRFDNLKASNDVNELKNDENELTANTNDALFLASDYTPTFNHLKATLLNYGNYSNPSFLLRLPPPLALQLGASGPVGCQ